LDEETTQEVLEDWALKQYLHWHLFAKMSETVTMAALTVLALATLGNLTLIELILLVSLHPRWPRQSKNIVVLLSEAFLQNKFASVRGP
jgi:hypothetical protein